MRDIAEQSVGWLVLGGIILAILVAKKRYENKFAAAVAAADANARAEVRNELGVGQSVNVAVDASHNRGAVGHQCGDPWSCEVCSPVLFRVLMSSDRGGLGVGGPRASGPARLDYHHDDDHYVAADTDDTALVGTTGASLGDNRGSGAGGRGPGGDARRVLDLEGAPCASVNGNSPQSKRLDAPQEPASTEFLRRYADALARPWAYDEGDPRCEVAKLGHPATGFGRGPGH